MSTFIPKAAARRALERCTPGPSGCLISSYSTGSHGYAQIGWRLSNGKNRMTTAHRAAWVAHTGEQIPDGMTVDHVCHVRRCVNPAHLRLLSNLANARDNRPPRDLVPPVTLLGRYCQEAHPLIAYASGQVTCRPCELRRGRKKYPGRRQRALEKAS